MPITKTRVIRALEILYLRGNSKVEVGVALNNGIIGWVTEPSAVWTGWR